MSDEIKVNSELPQKLATLGQVKDALGKRDKKIASLKGSVSTKITKFYKSNQGETHITDSDNGKIMDMMIYGKSSQDGTPTPENPVEIKSVVNPIVKVTNEDGLKVQSVTLNNITLNAIPVKSGGNVTIDGQQYIADYVDVEHGKVIRNILKWHLGDLKYGFNNAIWHINISELGIDGSKIGLSNMFKIQNGHYNQVTTSEVYIAYDGKIAALNMRGMTDEEFKKWLREKNPEVYNVLTVAEEIPITPEEALAFKQLMTYYPVTNVSVNSEQLDGLTVFNYPTPFEDEWNKTQKEIGGLKEETSSLKEDKITKPVEAPTIGKILRVKSVNEDGTFVCEWADGGSNLDLDVRIDGKSIVQDGVAEIPISSYDTLGLVRTDNSVGGYTTGLINAQGRLIVNTASIDDINKRHLRKEIDCSNFDYTVKAAMCDGKGATWTDTERLACLLRMGCTVDENGFVKWTAQEVTE